MNVAGAAGYLKALGFATASKWTIRHLLETRRLTPIRVGKKHYIAVSELDQLAVPARKNGAKSG
jgi:hypothetical protein